MKIKLENIIMSSTCNFIHNYYFICDYVVWKYIYICIIRVDPFINTCYYLSLYM